MDALKYAKPDKSTNLIISTYEKQTFNTEYPSLKYILDILIEISDKIYFIPANEVAMKHSGNLKTMNIVILGYIMNFLPLKRESFEESLTQHFSGTSLDMNLKVFNEGIKLK